jgi:5-methylcytosine-specific restriction enzyme A
MARLYDLQAWRRCSRAFLGAHPLCAQCEREGRVRIATQVDHKVPVKAGGALYDWSNLQALCDRCHLVKTLVVEQHKRLAGVTADGTPQDPAHPWNKEGAG